MMYKSSLRIGGGLIIYFFIIYNFLFFVSLGMIPHPSHASLSISMHILFMIKK